MNRELVKSKLAVSTIFIVLLLSIFVFATIHGSVAWFTGNKAVSASGMSISVKDPEGIIEKIEYFQIKGITLEIDTEATAGSSGTEVRGSTDKNIYEFNGSAAYSYTVMGAVENGECPPLGVFSVLEPLRQVLIKITFYDDKNITDISLKACTDAESYSMPSSTDNRLSSIIQFSAIRSGNVTDNGQSIVLKGSECTPAQSFTAIEDGEPKWLGSTITVSEEFAVDGNCVYILLDYNEAVAQYIKDNTQEELFSPKDGELYLYYSLCDFTFLVDRGNQ